jgi:hypothetical protein
MGRLRQRTRRPGAHQFEVATVNDDGSVPSSVLIIPASTSEDRGLLIHDVGQARQSLRAYPSVDGLVMIHLNSAELRYYHHLLAATLRIGGHDEGYLFGNAHRTRQCSFEGSVQASRRSKRLAACNGGGRWAFGDITIADRRCPHKAEFAFVD